MTDPADPSTSQPASRPASIGLPPAPAPDPAPDPAPVEPTPSEEPESAHGELPPAKVAEGTTADGAHTNVPGEDPKPVLDES